VSASTFGALCGRLLAPENARRRAFSGCSALFFQWIVQDLVMSTLSRVRPLPTGPTPFLAIPKILGVLLAQSPHRARASGV
jgi:hypothetical protein